jgi:RNA polymerase sigma-70 factor, ECF subfamily
MKSGDSSVGELELHIPGLRRFARGLVRGDREQADDLVQDCLERALSHWHQRRSDGSLRAWLYTILYNRFVADRHRRLRRQISLNSLTASLEEEAPLVEGGQEGALKCRDLLRGFAMLSEDQRAVLLLVAIDGFSYEDTAHILGVPIGTVMSRLSRGRERLREYMDSGRVSGGALTSPTQKTRQHSRYREYRPRLVVSLKPG